jgi:16S rRNA (guanine1207-N2)-methyltransferase
MIERLCGEAETIATRGHGRVVAARRPADVSHLRASLAAWRRTTTLEIGGSRRVWVFYPGVFAADRIDAGTALLMGVLPPLPPRASVLDYGCGSGLIGASAWRCEPGIALDMLDNDAVALAAAAENVPQGRAILGGRLADAGASAYDAILANPPLHRGIAEDHALLRQLVADAPKHLKSGGVLQIVVQRRVPLERLLAEHFATVTMPAENGRFRVWRGAVR